MNRFYLLAAALLMFGCSKNTPETDAPKKESQNEIYFQTKIASTVSDSGFTTLKDGTVFHLYFLESGQISDSRFVLGNSKLDISALPFKSDKRVTLFSIYPMMDVIEKKENRILIPQSLYDKDIMVMYKSGLSLTEMNGSLQTFSHAMHLLSINITDDVKTRTDTPFLTSLKIRNNAYLDLNDGKIKVDASAPLRKLTEKEGRNVSWYIVPQNIDVVELLIRRGDKELSVPLRSLLNNQESLFLAEGKHTQLNYNWNTGECRIITDVHAWGEQGEVASDINY